MADLPPSVRRLADGLRRLPGIGARNAQRIAIAVLRAREAWPEELADAIRAARANVRPCCRCGFFSEGDAPCEICRDPKRDATIICVVETANDVLPIERAGVFRGLYHCLGGKLSPIENVGPGDLAIGALLRRVREEKPIEVVLALGTDVEGETTSLYIAQQLRDAPARITRPALGLPVGGSLDVADVLTLGRALQHRQDVGA
ncbi:MAG TPA: recombination mediator RecR [Verrucomicrobiae bacterium]|nr:recombination mediator RecR [Verrucomicrobiae bacterium]